MWANTGVCCDAYPQCVRGCQWRVAFPRHRGRLVEEETPTGKLSKRLTATGIMFRETTTDYVTQTTAWKIKHKLMQAMMERDATKRLTGRIEIDDAYLGGERNGGMRGRGSPGKTPIVAAVETTPEGKPIRLKLRRVKGFRRAEIATLAHRHFQPASTVVSDGLHCFTGVGNAGCVHQPIITGSGRKAALNPAFKWVNTTLGNIKSAITGTYRTIPDKHVPRSLAEFESRFNRRYDLAAMMPRLGYVAVRTPP